MINPSGKVSFHEPYQRYIQSYYIHYNCYIHYACYIYYNYFVLHYQDNNCPLNKLFKVFLINNCFLIIAFN